MKKEKGRLLGTEAAERGEEKEAATVAQKFVSFWDSGEVLGRTEKERVLEIGSGDCFFFFEMGSGDCCSLVCSIVFLLLFIFRQYGVFFFFNLKPIGEGEAVIQYLFLEFKYRYRLDIKLDTDWIFVF